MRGQSSHIQSQARSGRWWATAGLLLAVLTVLLILVSGAAQACPEHGASTTTARSIDSASETKQHVALMVTAIESVGLATRGTGCCAGGHCVGGCCATGCCSTC